MEKNDTFAEKIFANRESPIKKSGNLKKIFLLERERDIKTDIYQRTSKYSYISNKTKKMFFW